MLFGGIITLLFLILISRIYYFQVLGGGNYYEMAKQRWSTSDVLTAKRGSILDRDGNVLAMDTIAYNISVNPKVIHAEGIEDMVVEGLYSILGGKESDIREVVTAANKSGEYYMQRELRKSGWEIEKAKADEIKQLKDQIKAYLRDKDVGTDDGIIIVETQKRYYPSGLASQLVGYVSLDQENMSGVEAFYNDKLSGEDGYIRYEKDGQQVQLAKGDVDYKPAENGDDVKLTIDSEIQNIVEEALRDVMNKYHPKSATAIAADPNTMEILAMANMPDFDPNAYWKSDYSSYYNHAIYSLYEPGSTFKIATLAAAVDQGLFDPNELYKSGSIKVPGDPKPISDYNNGKGWGTISFLDGLKRSSNVAFVKLGYEKLGKDKLFDYFNRFGFGQKTGIDLGNEPTGTIHVQYNRDIAATTFGQGVLVTPIQQVAAVAAVANGGKLYKPLIVKSITDPTTKTTTVVEPQLVRQVISESASKQVSLYLEQVVSDQEIGSGRNAYVEGYRVAGKTGTAQKVINGVYSPDKFFVSFIGYAPVDNPKIVIYIAIDEPDDPDAGGGSAAAPVFKEIVLKSLRKMGVAPNYPIDDSSENKEVSVEVPKATEVSVAQARGIMKNATLNVEVVGKGDTVLQQVPEAGSKVHPTQKIYLITEKQEQLDVPDLTGLSLRDALELTALTGARLVPEGTGYVTSQTEEMVNNERIVKVTLSPPAGSDQAVEQEGAADANSDSEEGSSPDNGDSESEAGAGSSGDQALTKQ